MAKQMMQDKASEMAATQTIPTGYKQTEVGVIPEDWDILSLGEIFTFKNGINKSKDFFGFGSPIVNYMDVYSSSCIDGECINGLVSVSELEKKNYSAVENDVFFTRTSETVNEVGLSSVLFGRVRDMVFSGFLLRARQRKNFFVGDYMKFCFREKSIRSQIQGTASYTTRALTNGTLLSKVLIPVPAKQEQSIIAKVLSDIDALIAALEQLIAKKQSIKTATMQQLLTGRARLPQFALRPDGTTKGYKTSELGQIPEDWITPTLKDITSNIIDYRGRTPRKLGLEWGGGNILALSAGNVKKGFIDYEAECYFGSDELYKKWMTSGDASKGDIVFTMEAPLGNAALIPNEDKYILSQRTILLQLERSKFLPMFIIQVFLSDMFQSYISESATGSTAQGIKRATFEKMFVAVPSCLEEQTAIATILSDMDSELTALAQKLAKARAVKQGMMQQLLTGRIRLPLPQEV